MASPKAIKKSEINLHDLGFDPAAPVPDRIAKLRALRGKTANIDLAIAKALGDISDLAAGEMLVEMEADATGALRREIRRAIYKLRQHDVEVREPEATTKPTAPATASEAGLTAFMSPIDAEGAQIIWMVKARARGGIVRLWGLVSETSGLVGLQNHALTRRELKSQHEELEKQAGIKLVEIDPQLADFILCDAYRRTSEADRLNVGTFYALRAEVTGAPAPTEIAHPIYSELGTEAAGEPSIELLKEPEIQEFRMTPEQLAPYLEEVNRAQESVLVVSRSSQEDRIQGAVEKAIDDLLGGARAYRMQRRLEDTALYMMKTGRRQQAGWAAAAAAKIRDGAELKKIAFFKTMVQTQLGAMIAQESERKNAEPRLIMTPAEAMRAREEQQARLRGRGR